MQIQMKLSGEILGAFEIVAEKYLGDREACVSKGYIVERAIEKFSDEFEETPWHEIRKYQVPIEYLKKTDLQTALVLSNKAIRALEDMQILFKEMFGMKRPM